MQVKLMDTLTDGKSRIVGFGGGIRGTKSWGSLAALITFCRIFPGSRWAVIRKDLQRLRDTTIPSFDKLRERTGGFVEPISDTRELPFAAKCRNGSAILFRGENIDKDPELNRFHGYEVNGFLNEEADELSERTFVKEIERAGTWIIPGDKPQPPAYILNTFNPCATWPRKRFYTPWVNKTIAAPYAFIPTTQADNPYITAEQREAWREMPEHEYNRFVKGDWESLTGAYYDTLTPDVLIERRSLPERLPDDWRYWASYDWGYGHWSVMGEWVTTADGIDILLDSHWLRKMQDDELAREYARDVDPRCLSEVYSGHDVNAVVKAHAASGESVRDVFAKQRIICVLADNDRVNGGRAVNRQLKNGTVKIVRTTGNLRVYDQLETIMPDENDIRKPAKMDADENGVGGDDGADMFRYGIATRVAYRAKRTSLQTKTPDRALPMQVKDGQFVRPPKRPQTVAELADWAEERSRQCRLPRRERERLPLRTYR